jgi:hypothetical protein
MGKNHHSSADTEGASRQFYADLPRPRDARACAEEADGAEAVMLDELAEAFRNRGCGAREAGWWALIAVAFFAKRDREVCGGEAAGAGEVAESAWSRETLRAMAVKMVQAPKPRFSIGCFILAMGMDHDGITSSNAWADRQFVSHELAADEVEEWQRLMKLPRNKWQKSAEAKASYKETNGKQRRE